MSTINPAYDACPVGMAVFFPWMTEAPNSDWILCDSKKYPDGTYPQMDKVRKAQPTNCRIDKPVYAVSGTPEQAAKNAESDEITLGTGQVYDIKYPAYKLFQPNDPTTDTDFWLGGAAGSWIHVTWKNGVRRQITGIELTARAVSADYRLFPTSVRLLGGHDGDTWRLTTSDVSLTDPGSAGTVYIPVDQLTSPLASEFRLEILAANQNSAISRLRIFAKDDATLIAPKVSKKLSQQPGVWCLRVSR